jgi:hypothetical protein
VNLTLSSATNGLVLGSQNTATLWIIDRDQSVQFSATTASVVEGKALTSRSRVAAFPPAR